MGVSLFTYQGAIRIRCVDEDGRRWPNECHHEPWGWYFVGDYDHAADRAPVVIVPIPKNGQHFGWELFDNALETLDDVLAHPEDYK